MEDETYTDVLNRCVTHSARIKFLIPGVLKNVEESMQVIEWAEGVLRLNGLEEPANVVHKTGEGLRESVDDIGEMLDVTRLDITELISSHIASLGKLIEEWTKIQEQK